MAAADAETASATAGFKATNFEKLSIGAVADATAAGPDTETVNLANLAFTEVTSAGAVDGDEDILALTNAASGLTLNITGEGLFTVGVKDAATNKTDVLNIASNSDGNLTLGTVTAANVETININAVDKVVDTTGAKDAFGANIGDGKDDTNSVQTLTVDAGAATTVNVSGSADLGLTVDSATALTAVNASTATGAVTYTANDGTTTVTGGSGNDVLTAAGDSDVLIGGAGNDKLTAATLTTLTGGEGNDTFVMSGAVDATKYSTITDLSSGDTIDTDATAFNTSKVVLAANATFAQYLDAAIVATAAQDNAASWFQFGGNTFIVNEGVDATTTYDAGQDGIIGITGLVDLSTATFNGTNGTFDIA
jgi:S-layer protein